MLTGRSIVILDHFCTSLEFLNWCCRCSVLTLLKGLRWAALMVGLILASFPDTFLNLWGNFPHSKLWQQPAFADCSWGDIDAKIKTR